ncbi:MAG: hypothetical protein ACK5DE_07545 [Bacteroidota bacterium]|jgi:hypothetical protein
MKVTIQTFQQLNNIAQSDLEDVDKAIEFVRIFTGKTAEQIDKMNVKKFNKLCKKVLDIFENSMQKVNDAKPSNWMWVKGKLFYINYNIAEISANKYVETAIFSQNLIDNLHKVMATMVYETEWTWKGIKVKPYDSSKHARISEYMLQADFRHCYHVAVFFYQLLRNSIVSLKPYMEAEAENPEKVEGALIDFIETMDGLPMPKWCQNLKVSV